MKKKLIAFLSLNIIVSLVNFAVADAMQQKTVDTVQLGREVALNRAKGNCLSCHHMPNEPKSESAGTIGPHLVQMKLRYPEKSAIRKQIWDAQERNKDTIMPPFGKHKILTEQEIDFLTDYIHQL